MIFHSLVDRFQKTIKWNRFHQVVQHIEVETFYSKFFIFCYKNKNRFYRKASQKINTAYTGHLYVKKHQVNIFFLQSLDRFICILASFYQTQKRYLADIVLQ